MPPSDLPPAARGLSRRTILKGAGAAGVGALVLGGVDAVTASAALAATAPVANARPDAGVQLFPFPLGAVTLTPSRFLDSRDRRLAYLRFLDMDRLLYNYRATAQLSTVGATPCGGWEAPDFGWRGHIAGHYLSGASMAVAAIGDGTLRGNVTYLVGELAKCQANATGAGYRAGYLGGFPESSFARMESGEYIVVWYTTHKLMAGLLDAYRLVGVDQALTVLLNLAGWVDQHTAQRSYAQMQNDLQVEFGGMNEVLVNLYQLTGDSRWLTVAQRFDHAAVFDPLAAGTDALNGLHANTQMAKIMGAVKEYEATGTARYHDIARNYWDAVVNHHTYCTGGNSDFEHYFGPDQISNRLSHTMCEVCNVYNLLKITRELFFLDPARSGYMDYYEWALYNEILAQQDPTSAHGRVTYYLDLRPGAAKVYDDDYGTFWCDTGSSMETYAKLNDSIYFSNGRTLYVNLFIPSVLTWAATGMTVTQSTGHPAATSTTLTFGGSGDATIKIRIPAWCRNARLTVNGADAGAATTPGTYASISRTWVNGDTLVLTLPMALALTSTPDDPAVQSISYGPVLLAGQYGAHNQGANPGSPPAPSPNVLAGLPVLDPGSITGTGTPLTFTATANGATVTLRPYFDTHNQFSSVYWLNQAKSAYVRLRNRDSGKVLGILAMGTDDGTAALQWSDTGTPDHQWELVPDGGYVKLRNANSGKLLGVDHMSTADGATVLQWSDNGTDDHDWTFADAGGGYVVVVNRHSGKVLDVTDSRTDDGAPVVQNARGSSTSQQWQIVPDGWVRIQNVNSGLLLGVEGGSSDDGAQALQWFDSGTADHAWTFVPDADGTFRIRNQNSGKVLGVHQMSTTPGGQVLQWGDTGTRDHLWRLVATGTADQFHVVNVNSGLLLGVKDASTSAGALCLQWGDNGTADQLWRFL